MVKQYLTICGRLNDMREVETLLKEAQAAAKRRGHQLGLFNSPDGQTYIAACDRCSGAVVVTPKPSFDENAIAGIAVNSDCPASQLA